MYSRRWLLRAIGLGALAAGAGCAGTEDGPSGAAEPTRPATGRPATRTRSSTARPTTREPTTDAASSTTTDPEPETTGTEAETATEPETAESPQPGWSERNALPVEQSAAGGAVLDGRLYYFGGFETGPDLNAVARAFRYDPAAGVDTDTGNDTGTATDTNGDAGIDADDPTGCWDRIADLPAKLWAPCGVASDAAVYSFGGAPPNSPYRTGDPPTDRIFSYSPGENWTNLTARTGVRCPYPNWAMTGAYDSEANLIYCVGGATAVTDRESATDHGTDSDSAGRFDETRVWTFDPVTGTVVDPDFARLPEGKRWATIAIVDAGGRKSLHAIGGGRGVVGPTDSNYRIDLATGAVTAMTPTPRPAFYATTANPVLDGEVYLTHARLGNDAPKNGYATRSYRYDPGADRFAELTARPEYVRSRAVDGVIDGRLYVAGGHVKRYARNDLHDAVRYNERYIPPDE